MEKKKRKVRANLNNYVMARLTEHAIELVVAFSNRYVTKPEDRETIEEVRLKADSDGYHRMQMWEFCAIFGEHMFNGRKQIIKGNILEVDSEPLPERPYCIVDGHVYKLEIVRGVLRFPDDGREMPDLNRQVLDYIEGRIRLNVLWDYDTNSGSSYERVRGIYSHSGMNNHIVKQGKEKTKTFKLYDIKRD